MSSGNLLNLFNSFSIAHPYSFRDATEGELFFIPLRKNRRDYESTKEFDRQFEGGNQEGEPWVSKVPTSLVYLSTPDVEPNLPDYSDELLP